MPLYRQSPAMSYLHVYYINDLLKMQELFVTKRGPEEEKTSRPPGRVRDGREGS